MSKYHRDGVIRDRFESSISCNQVEPTAQAAGALEKSFGLLYAGEEAVILSRFD